MKARVEQLEREILYHRAVYEEGRPEITDQEFDALEEQLKKLNPNSHALKKVGGERGQMKHKYPMLSQNKALTRDALKKWINTQSTKNGIDNFFASAKLDGMSCSIRYEKGYFKHAVSRGDGEFGVDMSAKVRLIVPNTLSEDFTGEIRGELVLSEENLTKLNQILPEPYKTTRNGAVGIINAEALNEEYVKFLNFVAFRLIKEDIQEKNPFFELEDNATNDYKFMEHLGFETAYYEEYSTSDDLDKLLDEFEDLRKDYYPLDGVVFRYLDNDEYISAGDTSHHPVGAIAWKYPSEYQDVVIREIEWSVGTKDITPVAVFNPTLIDGAMISRVSLKSVKNMIDKGVIVGCTARVHRSGKVIPFLERVISYETEQ